LSSHSGAGAGWPDPGAAFRAAVRNFPRRRVHVVPALPGQRRKAYVVGEVQRQRARSRLRLCTRTRGGAAAGSGAGGPFQSGKGRHPHPMNPFTPLFSATRGLTSAAAYSGAVAAHFRLAVPVDRRARRASAWLLLGGGALIASGVFSLLLVV